MSLQMPTVTVLLKLARELLRSEQVTCIGDLAEALKVRTRSLRIDWEPLEFDEAMHILMAANPRFAPTIVPPPPEPAPHVEALTPQESAAVLAMIDERVGIRVTQSVSDVERPEHFPDLIPVW